MKSKTKIKKYPHKAQERIEHLLELFNDEKRVKVGLPKESNDYPDGTSVISVAVTHEFGLDGVPERSFLRAGIYENREKYITMSRKLNKKLIRDEIDVPRLLHTLGLQAVNDVKAKILDGLEPELQYREGTPLIDTGHLIESITYQVD